MARFAFVTQSYSKDIRECELLCESMDRFAGPDVLHYIIVNDEDYDLFRSNPVFARRRIHRKGELMPRYMMRLPFGMLGHHYLVSPFTIPVREWIVQQICKLAIFEIMPPEIDAVVNIDSECVFLRPFGIDDISRLRPDGTREWMLYKRIFEDEPSHDEYCHVARSLLPLPSGPEPDSFCYMAHPVVFVRENLEALLGAIASRSLFHSWKLKLCNTYRFSEYYLYGLFCDYVLDLRDHYTYDTRMFPATHIDRFHTAGELREAVSEAMKLPGIYGVWLQKGKRSEPALPPDVVARTVRSMF